jgi:hypothetical protein
MKKYILPLSLALTASVAVIGQSKLDGNGQAVVNYYKQLLSNPDAVLVKPYNMPFEVNTKSRAATTAVVYITLNEGASADDIRALGFVIKASAGDMVIAEGSIEDIIELSENELVKHIAFGGQADPKLKRARAAVGADDMHNGTNGLSQSYTGKGVICGIYDIGIDPNHVNFNKRDQSESRVKHVWYYPAKDGNFQEYTTPEAIAGFTSDSKAESHGTHTLGCMAGAFTEVPSRNGGWVEVDEDGTSCVNHSVGDETPLPYYGIAYDSELAVSCGGLYDNNTTVAVSHMANYAKELGKPIVISLSIGSVVGTHDEYGTFTKFVDNVAKETGAIICIAAGNDGDENMSFRKTFTAADKEFKTFIELDNNYSTAAGQITVYSNNSTPFTVSPVIYDIYSNAITWNDVTISKVGTTSVTTKEYSDGDHYGAFNKAFSTSAFSVTLDKNEDTSNRFGATINYQMTYNSGTNNTKRYRLGFIIAGSEGQTIEGANTSSYTAKLTSNGLEGWDEATPEFSINSMACGKNVIVVGAYNANDVAVPVITGVLTNTFKSSALDFSDMPTGETAYYSSYGQLYDGRTLPHVCAPGSGVISSVNTYDTGYAGVLDGTTSSTSYYPSAYYTIDGKKYFWAQMSGTSMATPIVSGSIATWLEAYPELTVDEALDIIAETATKDDDVKNGNAVQWGAGKFNAIEGLKKVLNIAGVSNISAKDANVLVSNKGGNIYEAFVAGANKVSAEVYNMAGQLVAKASANGEQVEVDGSNLIRGVYVLRVNGNYSQRILVK